MNETKKLIVPAKLKELDKVLEFINSELESHGCSMKSQLQIDMAVEEIYANIAQYAYPSHQDGKAAICCTIEGVPMQATIQFIDHGVPYNPLEKKDPNVSLSAEDRQIGGLGIFLVKKSMDNVQYEYTNGKNVLTIDKKI